MRHARSVGEKLHEVGNTGVTTRFELFLNLGDSDVQLGGERGVNLLNHASIARNHMVDRTAVELKLVKAGAALKITASN